MTYTPGPWLVEGDEDGGAFVRMSDGRTFACLGTSRHIGISIGNARLIAAAPELFELVKSIRSDSSAYQWHKAADVVIAKIEGVK